MKLKKIFIALMMVTVVAVAGVLTACGDVKPITDKTEALEKLKAAAQHQLDVKSYTVDMTMEMAQGGQQMSMTGNMKMNDGSFTMTSSVKQGGVTVEMKIYYTDGYFYTDAVGSKTKMELDFEDAMEEILGGGSTEINDKMIDELASEKWTYEGKAEGKLYVFIFSGDEGTSTIKINEKNEIVYTLSESEGMKMEATYSYSTPTLEFPNDLDTYNEIDDEIDWGDLLG